MDWGVRLMEGVWEDGGLIGVICVCVCWGCVRAPKHRCKASAAAVVDGQTAGPLFPRTQHKHTAQQVCVPGLHV